jgi:hypothetical protein
MSSRSILLSAMSTELAAMAGTVDSLAGLVADQVRQSEGEARVRALVEAQAIDDLSQRLVALSGVAGAVAEGVDVETALAAVSLADLSQRLRGTHPTNVGGPVAQSVAGDVMLFE